MGLYEVPLSVSLLGLGDPLNLITVVLLVWVPNSSAILHKRANQRKVSSLLKLLWTALQVAMQKQKLGLALFVMVAICFDHSKSLLRVTLPPST